MERMRTGEIKIRREREGEREGNRKGNRERERVSHDYIPLINSI